MAEQKHIHYDRDDHLDGQGCIKAKGPVVEDEDEVEEPREAAQDDADELDSEK